MPPSRSARLDSALTDLLRQAPEVEAAAVVSFDGLPMASALPASMDEDRVAAMSAALLSLGERAAQGLGRGDLSQVYIEGEHGTVFLVSADEEAVLVACAARGAKVGMMLYEVRRAAVAVAEALRLEPEPAAVWPQEPAAAPELPTPAELPVAATEPHAHGYAGDVAYAAALPDPLAAAPEPAHGEAVWPSYAPQANGSAPTWS